MVFGAFIDKTLFVCIETFGLLEEEFSMTDIKPFYITILLQAINNMYDAGCSIAKKKQVFQVNLLQGITFWLALIDLISASLEIHNCNLWHLGKELYYYPVYLLDLFFCYFTEKYLFILA